eukprot:1328738-Rhodomonas_salina.2
MLKGFVQDAPQPVREQTGNHNIIPWAEPLLVPNLESETSKSADFRKHPDEVTVLEPQIQKCEGYKRHLAMLQEVRRANLAGQLSCLSAYAPATTCPIQA